MKFSAIFGRAARIAAPASLLAASLLAQSSDWRTPSSGFVYDSYARSIRPVIGLLGSAHLGASVATADWASIAPRGSSAWIVTEGKLSFIPDLARGEAAPLDGDWPLATDARWSADAKGVVLAGPGGVALASIDHDGSPRLERTLPLASAAEVRLLGASDDLAHILIATRAAEAQSWMLQLWGKEAALRDAGALSDPVASAFALKTGIAFVADAASRSILRLPLTGEGALEPVLDESHGISEPAGLVVSTDAASLFVVERSARTLRTYDLAARSLTGEIALDEAPGTPLAIGSGRYLLNQRTRKQQALLVLDIAAEPKVVFVPAGE